MALTKEQVETLIQAGTLAATVFVPVIGPAADAAMFVAAMIQIAAREGRMSDDEVRQMMADAKAEGKFEDDRWDMHAAKARANPPGIET
jgi:hypothetical protein